MTLRTLTAFAGAAAVLVLAGCTSAPKINTEFDKDANFSGYKTYALAPFPKKVENTDPGLLMRLEPAVSSTVRQTMIAKGFSEVADPKAADIAVLVHGKVVPKTDVTDWGMAPMPSRYGWYRGYPYGGMYGGSNVTVDQYEEGTLSIEVYEVASKKQVWVGWVTGRKSDKGGDVDRITKAVADILANFPPGSAPAK